jgi:hypothetical protein
MAKQKLNKETVQKIVAKDGYPEVGTYTDKKDLQKFYKHCTMDQLQEWVDVEGLTDTVSATDSEPILRMRLCMAILYKHFPKPEPTKKKSKYSDYTNEQLLQLAIDKDVVFEMTDDERILRMRAIMALRAAKVIE